MSTEENWARRVLDSKGSNFRIDVNNPQTSPGGKDVWNLYSHTQETEDVCLAGLQENGIFRLYNDRTIEIVGGQRKSENDVDIIIRSSNGDICINADRNGKVRIRGKNVEIQADEDVDITAGRNVNIKSGSGRILLGGNTLEKDGLKGNLLEAAQQWAYRVFDGTGLPGFAFAALTSGFSGITSLAGNFLSNPNLFSGFISGAIDSAVGSVTGAAVGSITQAVPGALGQAASFAAQGALGSISGGGGLGGALSGAASGALGGLTGGSGISGALSSAASGALGGGSLGSIAGGALSSAASGALSGGSLGSIASGALSSAASGAINAGSGALSGALGDFGGNSLLSSTSNALLDKAASAFDGAVRSELNNK